MITLIKVDNYKAFRHFEYRPRPFELLLGDNGSGKTSVFDALSNLRKHIVHGHSCRGLFPSSARTAWTDDLLQSYEMWISRDSEFFSYKLTLSLDPVSESSSVLEEEVRHGSIPLFQAKDKQATLYKNDGVVLAEFPVATDRSAIPGLGYRDETSDLNWFRDFVRAWFFVSPKPFPMRDEGRDQFTGPAAGLTELASWIRTLVKTEPSTLATVEAELTAAVDGFKQVRLVPLGSTSDLVMFDFRFGDSGREFSLRLSDLSHSRQRSNRLFSAAATMIGGFHASRAIFNFGVCHCCSVGATRRSRDARLGPSLADANGPLHPDARARQRHRYRRAAPGGSPDQEMGPAGRDRKSAGRRRYRRDQRLRQRQG